LEFEGFIDFGHIFMHF